MKKNIFKTRFLILIFSTLAFVSKAQSIIRAPGRLADYTVTGFFTPAAPVIDGILDDYAWSAPYNSINPPATGGGAGYNTTTGVFPAITEVKEIINLQDAGTNFATPPANNITTYPANVMATFGIVWDKDFLYFAVKVPEAAFAGATSTTAGIELYFNNGYGRSRSDPISSNWPRNYSNIKDMSISIYRVPGTIAEYYTTNSASVGWFGINPSSIDEYQIAAIKNPDGSFTYEGKISWKVLYTEFVDVATGILSKFPHKSTVAGLGFDLAVNGLEGTQRAQKMWNQCCFNGNWTQSQYFGYLDLEGDIVDVTCPTAITITGANNISAPNGQVTLGTIVEPSFATKLIQYTLLGTSGNYDLAIIDSTTGKIRPLNNGVLTIIGKANHASCTLTVSSTLTISNQIAPTSFSISGDEIVGNWNRINMSATANPANATNQITWSLDPPTNLATINSITGALKATALGNGTVSVKATSLANGVSSAKTVAIRDQVVLSCVGINSFTRVNQCDRTLNNMTITQFTVGSLLEPFMQFYDYNENITRLVPTDLVDFELAFPASAFATISKNPNWVLQLNAAGGTFTITGTYKNDPSIVSKVRVVLRASTIITDCDNSTPIPRRFNMAYACDGFIAPTPICTLPGLPASLDNNSTSITAGPQTYSIIPDDGVTYTWGVSGNFNSVTAHNNSSATIYWTNPGILRVTPSNSCGSGTSRTLSVAEVFVPTIVFPISTVPAITFPPNRISLTWPTVAGAVTYCIQIAKDESFSEIVLDTCGLSFHNIEFDIKLFNKFNARMQTDTTKYYYKVAGSNETGKSAYSLPKTFSVTNVVLSTTSFSDNSQFGIYPNPNDGKFIVSTIKDGICSIQSVEGKLVFQANVKSGENKFSLTLPSGLYLVDVNGSKQKLIIE